MVKRPGGAAWILCLTGISAAAQAPEPQMQVAAAAESAGGKSVVRVALSAPLPDGTIVAFGLYYGREPREEARVAHRRTQMKGGTAREEMVGDTGTFFPGDYLVLAHVDEDQPVELRRRIAPPLRRLAGQTDVVVGNRAQVCDAVNKMCARLLALTREVHKLYPVLDDLLDRAWNKKLSASEWRSWGPRAALEKTRDQLTALAYSRSSLGRLLPFSLSQTQTLTAEIAGMCASIDDLLRGFVRDNDNLVKPKQANQRNNPPSIVDLNATLYREGIAVYASTAGRVFDEVQTAYAQRTGKGAGNWETLHAGWSRSILELDNLADAFDKLEWMAEKMDKAVRLKEALLGLRDFAGACGNVLKGEATEATAELAKRRETVRALLEGLSL